MRKRKSPTPHNHSISVQYPPSLDAGGRQVTYPPPSEGIARGDSSDVTGVALHWADDE